MFKVRLRPTFPASEEANDLKGCTYFANDWWHSACPHFLCCNTIISAVQYHVSMKTNLTCSCSPYFWCETGEPFSKHNEDSEKCKVRSVCET